MKTVRNIVLIVIILGAGIGLYSIFVMAKTKPGRQEIRQKSIVVETMNVDPGTRTARVTAMGTVIPAREVAVSPQVGGRIITMGEKFLPGSRMLRGDLLVRIDPSDYDAALENQQANVTRAGVELAREKGLKSVAEAEWELIGSDDVKPDEEGRKLALRELQLKQAEANLKAAQSSLSQARLNRERTVVNAPFNSIVREKFVDVGQVVAPGTRIGTMVDSDVFWVRVSVPMDRLKWIMIPGVNSERASAATVIQQVSGDIEVTRTGKVIKLLGDLDPKGRMVRLLVEVENPLDTGSSEEASGLPLLLDAYVKVIIEGPEEENVFSLPRGALRDSSTVWILDDEDRLRIKDVEVLWSLDDMVFVRNGIGPDDRIITSRIGTPVEGMILRTGTEPGK